MKIRVRRKDLEKRLSPAAEPDVADDRGEEIAARPGSGHGVSEGYADLYENLYHAVLIVGEDGRVRDSNRRAREFFAAGKDELDGSPVGDLVYGMDERMLRKVRENIFQGRYTVLNGTCLRRNGGRFAAEIALSGMRDRHGQAVVFSIRNHSRVDGIQTQLRTEHNALDNAASAIVVTDIEGKAQFVNKSFISLWRLNDEQGALDVEMADLWMQPEDARDLLESPRRGESWNGELLALRRDGEPFWVQALAAPNRDETDEVSGMVFSFIDISERYKAQESIRKEVEGQMDQAKTRDQFSGLLNIIRIEDVMQLVDSAGKSGQLVIRDESGGVLGSVSFADGRVIAAEAGKARGKEAVVELLRGKGHSFEFASGSADPAGDGAMNVGTTSLLLDASRIIDEEG